VVEVLRPDKKNVSELRVPEAVATASKASACPDSLDSNWSCAYGLPTRTVCAMETIDDNHIVIIANARIFFTIFLSL
jgi:hypothetical protein